MNAITFFLFFIILNTSLVSAQSFEQKIQSSSDDAEEKHDGSYVALSSSDLELVYDSWNSQEYQTIGLRFVDINIPANAIINNAYIQFTAKGATSGDCTINIKGESTANSMTFSNTINNISNRTTTITDVNWNITNSWNENQSGTDQRTTNLSSIINEIINSNSWQYGSPMSFILNGNSDALRRAFSYDDEPLKSAKLVIDYTSLIDIDLSVTSIEIPTDFMYPTAYSPIHVEVNNFGNLSVDNYSVSFYIEDNLIATETSQETLNSGQSTLFSFTQSADFSLLGNYSIRAEVNTLNEEDLVPYNDDFTKTVSIIPEFDSLFFPQGSSWHYWDSISEPDALWNSVNYIDSSWSIGMSQLGFGDSDEQTVLNSGVTSYYFRKKVNISDLNTINSLYLHMIHDDAAIVFINGQEALRTELMPIGQIDHQTSARQSSNSSNENEFYTYKINADLFTIGINTIAISLHNRSVTNSDLSFDCYITSEFQYNQDGPYVFYQRDSIVVKEVTPNGVISAAYTSKDDIELTCHLPHMNASFSFPLKDEILIEPSEQFFTPSKFLSISDFDGHIEAFSMVLKAEGIIDDNFKWTYDDGHLIISGDLFDRGFNVTECMWLLYKLEGEAELVGGKVHLIIGNHEMFNLRDDWRYVEVKYFNNAHLLGKRMIELYDSNTELGRWLRSKNIIERIGNYAFMHGGISPELSALNLTYNQINNYGRLEMEGNCISSDCEVVNGSKGIYWYRGMAEEELTQEEVDDFVTELGVERIIIGHTKDSSVRSLYNGRVLAIDMYHIDNFDNGYMEALQFELGCFYKFYTDANEQTYTLIDECDEFDTTNVMEINTLGQLQIYPNPTVSSLNIKLPLKMLDNYDYSIVNVEGKTMRNGILDNELSSISLLGFKSGKYFIVLKSENSQIIGHFILIE